MAHVIEQYANYQQEWQKKLSGLKVTDLPWDPKPAPVPKTESTAPANVKPPLQTLPSNGNVGQSSLNTLPPIKSEPGSYPSHPPPQKYAPPRFPQGHDMTSAQRAAMNLHQGYGNRAAAQIAQLQHQPGQMPPQGAPAGPHIKPDVSSPEQYRQPHQSVPIKSEQTDGAGDEHDTWKAEYARRKAAIAGNRERNDRTIRDQVLASQQQLEGGGVLRPLEEHNLVSGPSRALLKSGDPSSSLARAQGDATGDDDEDEDEKDEDAINSDLDDPDDELENPADGEDMDNQVMLCTYDKVQRVKNKWKCTLKDGILRVDGSEILFHKGSGEFEW